MGDSIAVDAMNLVVFLCSVTHSTETDVSLQELSHGKSRGARSESHSGNLPTRWENAITSLKQHAVQISRETGPADAIFEEWRHGIAATCNCRASDLGSAEHDENIGPCVSGASSSETASDAHSEDLCN